MFSIIAEKFITTIRLYSSLVWPKIQFSSNYKALMKFVILMSKTRILVLRICLWKATFYCFLGKCLAIKHNPSHCRKCELVSFLSWELRLQPETIVNLYDSPNLDYLCFLFWNISPSFYDTLVFRILFLIKPHKYCLKAYTQSVLQWSTF